MNTTEKLQFRFTNLAVACQARLDLFTTKFQEDPVHALTWSNDTFANAAKLRVVKQILAALDGETKATLENIRSTLTDRVLHRAKYPPQSTSPTSNLIEQYELAACAEILSDLQYME